MKSLSKTLLAAYVLLLLWIVLFKFSYDFSSVLLEYQKRSLNLVPFAATSRSEMISNCIVFIPFGLLLSVSFKQTGFWRKLAIIFTFSLAVEVIQYILAIGATDITDVLMNTLGGLLGLMLYTATSSYVDHQKLDRFITIAGIILLILLLLVRVMVFKVRY